MNIIFVRHAETPENVENILQGESHRGFTDIGKVHLRQLKKELDKYRFDVAFVSDLPRTQETARYILHGRENIIKLEPLLREKSSGEFAGKKAEHINWDELEGGFENRKPPGGESLEELKIRVEKFLEKLKTTHANDVLVITHGTFLKVLTGTLRGFDMRQSIFENPIDHCSITTVKLSKGGFDIIGLNRSPESHGEDATTHIALGTTSELKAKFLEDVLAMVRIKAYVSRHSVESGVSEQPMSSGETKMGAINRAKAALSNYPEASLGVGIEAGFEQTESQKYSLIVWVAAVKGDELIIDQSDPLPLPEFFNGILVRGDEVCDYLDEYLAMTEGNPTRHKSAIEIKSREPYIKQALLKVIRQLV